MPGAVSNHPTTSHRLANTVTSAPQNCRKCARAMIPRGGDACPPDHVQHAARGLCRGCHSVAIRNGTIDDYPLHKNQHAHMIEDFQFIAESSGGRRVDTLKGWDKATRVHAAGRLNVTVAALDRALERDAARRAA